MKFWAKSTYHFLEACLGNHANHSTHAIRQIHLRFDVLLLAWLEDCHLGDLESHRRTIQENRVDVVATTDLLHAVFCQTHDRSFKNCAKII